MDDLVTQIAQRTGITEQQARDAVETVATFLKAQLPTPIAVQIDGVLSGQSGQDIVDQGQEMITKLGGRFGQT